MPSLRYMIVVIGVIIWGTEAWAPIRSTSINAFIHSTVRLRPQQQHQLLSRRIALYAKGKGGEAPAKDGLFSGLFGKKTVSTEKPTRKRIKQRQASRKAGTTNKKTSSGKNAAPAKQSTSRFQRQTLQRDNSWDVIEKEKVPLSSIAVGVAGAAGVGGFFFKKWWTKRNEKLMGDFVDDMMAAGMDTSELYRVAVSYKAKLGPFATPRILNEYLKAVFRAPDLSSQFVEAMDLVINKLLKVKDQELMDTIGEIARDMAKGQEFVGMSILLFTFERILPEDMAVNKLEPLRRALSKALPGNVADNMFELAKDAYSLEVESLFVRGESPLVAPEGYEVLGLREDDAEAVFRRVKRNYEGEVGGGLGGGEGGVDGENLGQSLIVKRKEPLHDMIYGRAEDIADKYIVGYKEEKEKKKMDAIRGRPPSWDETVQRISRMVLTKEGEEVINTLQKFQCMRCQRLTTLMPSELEDEIFTPDYKCPSCGSGRNMVIRKS